MDAVRVLGSDVIFELGLELEPQLAQGALVDAHRRHLLRQCSTARMRPTTAGGKDYAPRVRRIAMLPAFLALVVLVVACGDDGGSKKSATTPKASTATSAASTSSAGSEELALASEAFEEGGEIPAEHTCDGADTSPPVSWSGVPDGAVELALVVDDADAEGFVHALLAGIDPADGGIAEGAVPEGAVVGINDFGQTAWNGPCPPPGDGPHRYVFTLYALSAPSGATAGVTASELRDSMLGSSIGETELTATFDH